MEPGKQQDVNPKSIWRKVGECCCKIKTAREKKDQPPKLLWDIKWLKNIVNNFFFLENAKNLGRSDDAKRRKKRGWPYFFSISITIIPDFITFSSSTSTSLDMFLTRVLRTIQVAILDRRAPSLLSNLDMSTLPLDSRPYVKVSLSSTCVKICGKNWAILE